MNSDLAPPFPPSRPCRGQTTPPLPKTSNSEDVDAHTQNFQKIVDEARSPAMSTERLGPATHLFLGFLGSVNMTMTSTWHPTSFRLHVYHASTKLLFLFYFFPILPYLPVYGLVAGLTRTRISFLVYFRERGSSCTPGKREEGRLKKLMAGLGMTAFSTVILVSSQLSFSFSFPSIPDFKIWAGHYELSK